MTGCLVERLMVDYPGKNPAYLIVAYVKDPEAMQEHLEDYRAYMVRAGQAASAADANVGYFASHIGGEIGSSWQQLAAIDHPIYGRDD